MSAARQVIRARDAEQGALRRRAEHFRRDLLQAESLAVQQTNEVDLIRIPKHSEEIGLTICPMKRGWFNHELMICAPDMSSHRMVTITGEAHVMKLVIAPLHVQLNEYDNNEGSFFSIGTLFVQPAITI